VRSEMDAVKGEGPKGEGKKKRREACSSFFWCVPGLGGGRQIRKRRKLVQPKRGGPMERPPRRLDRFGTRGSSLLSKRPWGETKKGRRGQ